MSPVERVESVVYRSNRLRIIVLVASVGLVGLSYLFWVALPANLKAEFTLSQAVTLLLILGLFVFALLVVGSGVVKADADGVFIRNGLSRHRVGWDRIHRFVLRPGDAWAHVLLIPTDRPLEEEADLERRMMMGIQTGDGAYATGAVADLNRRLRAARARPDG
jgi:hypothetical protein